MKPQVVVKLDKLNAGNVSMSVIILVIYIPDGIKAVKLRQSYVGIFMSAYVGVRRRKVRPGVRRRKVGGDRNLYLNFL